jgi:membrane protease subunit HflC
MRVLWLSLLACAVLLAAWLSVFTVDRTEYVYLTQFGRHVATFDGADEAQAGLHFKWPWPIQATQRFDRRLQYFDLSGAELMTRDPNRDTIDRTLTIDAYVTWRIADADSVDRFNRTVGSADGARARLAERISSDLGIEITKRPMDDLVSTEWVTPETRRVDQERAQLRDRLLTALRDRARADYGIEVVDIRLRRVNYPAEVHDTIYERIRSERERKAADYQSEGERQAADIRTASDRRINRLKARSEAEAVRIRGLGDAFADKIRTEAQARDPEFFAFLREMEGLQKALGDGKTLLLLSTKSPLFDRISNPPGPHRMPPKEEKKPGEGGD